MPFFPGLPDRKDAHTTKGSRSHDEQRDPLSAEPAGRSATDNNPSVEEEEPTDTKPTGP